MQAFFLPAGSGARFCVHHVPAHPARGVALVVVPAFGEEMNKSRHVVAQAARALSAAGVGVLAVDLLGCGDSSGSFADASWAAWLDDTELALAWMRSQGYSSVWLWGIRCGALLAAESARRRPSDVQGCLFWQPVVSGEAALVQFLRLRAASAMIAGTPSEGASVRQLRDRLAAGETIEVAGYALSPALAKSLAAADLAGARPGCAVRWIEVVAEAGRGPGAASAQVIDGWQAAGAAVDTDCLVAEPFWAASNAAELVHCPAIVRATVAGAGAWLR